VNYDINFFKNKTGANERKPLVFFYPTSPEKYKNYELIFNTLISNRNVLLKAGVRFIITLDKNDSKIIKNYYNILQNLQIPIEFVGRLEPNKIYEIMTESVLIFPSLVETFGLPLLEAMTLNRRILAADLPYANEVLCGYENVSFFNPKSKEELFKLMNIEIDKSLIKTGIKKMLNSY
jgi:glycosyltransferase involved in cell wall biosynthesis